MSSPRGNEIATSASRQGPDDLGNFNAMVHLMHPVLLKARSEPILVTDDWLPAWNTRIGCHLSFRWSITALPPPCRATTARQFTAKLTSCMPAYLLVMVSGDG